MKAKIQNYIAKDTDSNSDDIHEMLKWTGWNIVDTIDGFDYVYEWEENEQYDKVEAELKQLKEIWDEQCEEWEEEARKCEKEWEDSPRYHYGEILNYGCLS